MTNWSVYNTNAFWLITFECNIPFSIYLFPFTVETLPLSIDQCPTTNETLSHFSFSQKGTENDPEYFYLYKISYAWYTLTGKLLELLN